MKLCPKRLKWKWPEGTAAVDELQMSGEESEVIPQENEESPTT